ncbi:hypothetical protein, partial [Agromyces bauzanensis]|uniref:hypothetical protein n=1 Tax=Agromyces bauzanensis TaxID=1308924 RepID=UPI0031F09415
QPTTCKRAPETESVDHDAFERLRRDVERARRRRVLWVTLAIAALPFAGIAALAMFSATLSAIASR